MQNSQIPPKVYVPFADSGAKNIIPVVSQIGITPGAASFVDGFPPATRTPIESGGTPPDGLDFNGIFNVITAWNRWQAAGGPVFFDQAFVNATGGYPFGARLASTTNVAVTWISLIDNNGQNPDVANTNWYQDYPQSFTPVQQGGGFQQLAIKLFLGWAANSKLRLTVDTTDEGNIALESWVSQNFQNILGFTPVEQGGGFRQGAYKVHIGWTTASKLALTIDYTDIGNIAVENWVAATYLNKGGDTMTGGLTLPTFHNTGNGQIDGTLSVSSTIHAGAGVQIDGQLNTNGHVVVAVGGEVYSGGRLIGRTQSNGTVLGYYAAATLNTEFALGGNAYGTYQKLPSGLIIQTFGFSLPEEGYGEYNFPIAFPNNVYAVLGALGTDGAQDAILTIQARDNGAFKARLNGPSPGGSNGCAGIAIGN